MKRYFNSKYVKSGPAAIKVIELLSLLGAAVTVFIFNYEVKIEGDTYTRVQFFLLVTTTAWIVEFVVFILLLLRLTKNLPVPWPWVNMTFGLLFGIFTLIATGLLAQSVAALLLTKKQWPLSNRQWETINYCQFIDRTQNITSCLALQGGMVFGFLGGLLFLVEIYINSKEARKKNYFQEPGMTDNEDATAITIIK